MPDQQTQEKFITHINDCRGIIYKICNLYTDTVADREDLFQEIVIQLWKAFPKFRSESKFSTWLYRVALNTAISDLRKQKRNVELSFPEFIPLDKADVKEESEKEEKLKQLYEAISQLNEIDKAVVLLYLDENSYEEMESILGISNNTLRVKMNRIKEKLRQLTKTEMY